MENRTPKMAGAKPRWSAARGLFLLVTFGGLLAAASACGGSNTLGPDNQVEVNNATDSFQWQASNMEKINQTLTYTWTNTGTTADVNQASSLSGGSATLQVTDADGQEVYSRSLAENGTFQTSQGASGDWTVTVELSDASGAVNFRLQKP